MLRSRLEPSKRGCHLLLSEFTATASQNLSISVRYLAASIANQALAIVLLEPNGAPMEVREGRKGRVTGDGDALLCSACEVDLSKLEMRD